MLGIIAAAAVPTSLRGIATGALLFMHIVEQTLGLMVFL